MRFAFRADASLEIGTGHVMRCLALAQELLNQSAEVSFIARELPGNMIQKIMSSGIPVHKLPAPGVDQSVNKSGYSLWAGVDPQQDAVETSALLGRIKPDWLVVDHYAFDADWEKRQRRDGMRIMVIDDLANRPHDCDLLLDQNLGRDAGDYAGLVPEECGLFVGPKYALLRPEFASLRSEALHERICRSPRKILVSLGGVDSADVTSQVLSALRGAELPIDSEITVVMGSHAPALEVVRKEATKMSVQTAVLVDVDDLAERMADADLSIGAGGATTWERCCLGLPTIVIRVAENQSTIVTALVDAGAGVSPGSPDGVQFISKLVSIINRCFKISLLKGISHCAAKLCDGDGAKRIAQKFCEPELTFRDARREDSRRIWEWREQTPVSFRLRGEETPFEKHDEWFTTALADSRRLFRILVAADLPLGYTRVDRTKEDAVRLSICLSNDARGKRLGYTLLEEATTVAQLFSVSRLEAEIHKNNQISRKLFKNAGYVQAGADQDFLYFRKNLETV